MRTIVNITRDGTELEQVKILLSEV